MRKPSQTATDLPTTRITTGLEAIFAHLFRLICCILLQISIRTFTHPLSHPIFLYPP